MRQEITKDTSGVYLIQCKTNGRMYIGSSKCIQTRWRTHIDELYKNRHHSIKLQEDWIKYGEDNFEFKVLKECSPADSRKYEIEYIEILKSDKFGYNFKDIKDQVSRRYNLMNQLILKYVKDNGYESNGNCYWFNIFEMSDSINYKITEILNHFQIQQNKRWNISYKVTDDTYIGINWDKEDGVQIIAFDESYLTNEEYENIKCS